MSKEISSEQEFEAFLKSGKSVLVLFYASWCPHSRRFLPIFEKHAKAQNCLRVMTHILDGCEDKFSIEAVPTVLYFEKGTVVKRLDAEPGVGLDEKQLINMMKDCGQAG